jgi:hypothetical protein
MSTRQVKKSLYLLEKDIQMGGGYLWTKNWQCTPSLGYFQSKVIKIKNLAFFHV